MTTFLATLNPMLTLFICIAVGFVATKCKILPENASKAMAKMETWIFCPALGIMTMSRYCTVDKLFLHATNIILAACVTAFSMAIAIFLSRFFAKKGTPERGIYAYALAFANGGYMGDPVVQSLFGDLVLSYYKLFYIPLSLMINSWGVTVLTPAGAVKGATWKRLLNAPTVATLIGIFLGLSGIGAHMPSFLTNSLDTLSKCMGPVAMLLAGVTIAKYDFVSMLKKGKVYVASALRLVILPILIVGFLFGLKTLANAVLGMQIGNDVLFLAFFALATPLGLNTVVFPEAYGGNPETGASMAMISHTLCVASIPLMYALMVAIFGVPFQA